ncbi:MAG: heavy-metal-associated domain-containing protein [Sphingobacteriales bacterium]|nr:heavy-metal-associated domain-containing protein [Sphingobacteriales bacterium]
MKNLFIFLGAIVLMAAANVCGCGVCKANATGKTVKQSPFLNQEEPKTVTLKITGMSCAGCSNHIHTALSKTEGVISDDVKYPGEIATIKYDAAKISEKEIIAVIEKAGYKAEVIKSKGKSTVSANETKTCCSKG